MQLEIIVRNAGGRVTDMAGHLSPTSTATVPLAFVKQGSEIEAVVKDNDGKRLGTFVSPHVFQTRVVSAIQFEDGGIAVTDDASNTYYRE